MTFGLNDGGQKTLFVADTNNHKIRAINLESGNEVTTIAGASPGTIPSGYVDADNTSARFKTPRDVAYDPLTRNLYVSDEDNRRIRMIALASPSDTVSTVAGNGLTYNNYSEGAGLNATFSTLRGLIFWDYGSGDKRLILADADAPVIREISLSTLQTNMIAGSYVRVWASRGFTGSKDGKARSFIQPQTRTSYFDGTYRWGFSHYASIILRTNADFSNPIIVAGQNGRQGVVDGIGPNARVHGSGSNFVRHGDWLYFAEEEDFVLRRFSLTTNAVETIAGSKSEAGILDGLGAAARFCSVKGLAIIGDRLYAADECNHTIRAISLATADFGLVTTIAGTASIAGYQDGAGLAAKFNSPNSLVAVGNVLYITDTTNALVRSFNTITSEVATFAGTLGSCASQAGIGLSAKFCQPTGIVYDGHNHLYVNDFITYAVQKIRLKDAKVWLFAGEAFESSERNGPLNSARLLPINSINVEQETGLIIHSSDGFRIID